MSAAENKRSHRVAQVLQRELADILTHGLKDPRVGFCTVTEVRLTDDLKTARVYVSVLGALQDRENSLAGLTAAKGFLRREIATRTQLRYVPDLTFLHDDTLDRVERIDALIAGATEQDVSARKEQRGTIPVHTDRSELAERSREFENTPPAREKKRRRHRR